MANLSQIKNIDSVLEPVVGQFVEVKGFWEKPSSFLD